MADLATLRASVRNYLQDIDSTQYVFPGAMLDAFLSEGLRQLEGHCFRRAVVEVQPNGTNEFDLAVVLGAPAAAVEGVLAIDWSVGDWEEYGGTLIFVDPPTSAFFVRAACNYQAVTELPALLADAVVFYAAGRALLWLQNRGGTALQRYLANQGELDPESLSRLADMYQQDYFRLREEQGGSTIARL